MNITKAIPPISAESIKLRDYLKDKINEGDIVTMEMMSTVTGRDMSGHLGIIYSAIRHLEKSGIVYYRIRNIGWQRVPLGKDDVIDGESGTVKVVNRKIRRSLARLAAVRFGELSNEDKIRHSTISSQIGTVALFTNANAADKIKAKVITNGAKPDASEVLKLFNSGK